MVNIKFYFCTRYSRDVTRGKIEKCYVESKIKTEYELGFFLSQPLE
ncbi:hypothetical protein D046_2867 [Vibrio parahaemolyticus V-223/04]|nr:hypothetical protein D045_0722 [Vibrio parahaemolyticus VP-NY4]EVU17584.1 hypothetical protein D046_2867 [Vibrio parahaemolyticus V-223/04]